MIAALAVVESDSKETPAHLALKEFRNDKLIMQSAISGKKYKMKSFLGRKYLNK
jgi:hypothetical protein